MKHIKQTLLTLATSTLLAGCTQTAIDPTVDSKTSAIESGNGLLGNGLSANGWSGNGLLGNGLLGNGLLGNGLSVNGILGNGLLGNGLSGSALTAIGLVHDQDFVNWLHADPAHNAAIMKYVVRCALPRTQSLTYVDPLAPANSYTWPGLLGLAPNWTTENHHLDSIAEQKWMSACLVAHINSLGMHVDISVRSNDPAAVAELGASPTEMGDYSGEEGSYFGNLFAAAPVGYGCYNGTFKNMGHPLGRACDSVATDCGPAAPVPTTDRDPKCYNFCDRSRMSTTLGNGQCAVNNEWYPTITVFERPIYPVYQSRIPGTQNYLYTTTTDEAVANGYTLDSTTPVWHVNSNQADANEPTLAECLFATNLRQLITVPHGTSVADARAACKTVTNDQTANIGRFLGAVVTQPNGTVTTPDSGTPEFRELTKPIATGSPISYHVYAPAGSASETSFLNVGYTRSPKLGGTSTYSGGSTGGGKLTKMTGTTAFTATHATALQTVAE